MIQRIAESITLVVAFVAGLAAVIIILVSTFGPDFYNDRNVALATLSVVGLVAVAVSLERITVLSNLRQDIAEIDSSLRSRLGGQYLKGRKAIYSHTLSTIVGAEEEIVSVIVGSAPRAPDFWFKAIVDRLRESKKADNELMWNVYLAFPAGDERAGLAIARRMQSLEMSGVADQVHLWHVPWKRTQALTSSSSTSVMLLLRCLRRDLRSEILRGLTEPSISRMRRTLQRRYWTGWSIALKSP